MISLVERLVIFFKKIFNPGIDKKIADQKTAISTSSDPDGKKSLSEQDLLSESQLSNTSVDRSEEQKTLTSISEDLDVLLDQSDLTTIKEVFNVLTKINLQLDKLNLIEGSKIKKIKTRSMELKNYVNTEIEKMKKDEQNPDDITLGDNPYYKELNNNLGELEIDIIKLIDSKEDHKMKKNQDLKGTIPTNKI